MQKTLTLRDFISNTLVDINEAVKDASKKDVEIVYQRYQSGKLPTAKSIEFDIAIELTESEGSDKQSGAGLQVSILNLGLNKSKSLNSDTKNMNRIRFSVDIFLGMERQNNKED